MLCLSPDGTNGICGASIQPAAYKSLASAPRSSCCLCPAPSSSLPGTSTHSLAGPHRSSCSSCPSMAPHSYQQPALATLDSFSASSTATPCDTPSYDQQPSWSLQAGSALPAPLFLSPTVADKAIMVAHLIGKAAQIIESVWPSSHQSIHYSSKTPVMPLHVFVKETLRRSRTTLSTLQLALFYIYKVKAPVLALQRRQDVSQRALQPRLPPSPSVSWDERSDSGHMPHEYFEFTQPILSRTTLPPTPPYACNTPSSLSPVSRVTTTMGEPVAENAKHVGCGRRMFLAALILASKYQQDRSYSNKAWSKISGLPVAEINRNEIAFLALIEYRLFVSPSVFQKWVVVLTDTTHVTERPALSRSNSTPKMGSGALANRRYAMRRNSAQYDPLGHVGSNGLCPSALPSCIALSALDIPSELPGSATPTRLIPEQQRDAGSYMTQQWVETQRRELLQSRSCVPPVHPSVLSRATVVGKVDPLWGEGQTVMAQDRGCGVLPSPTSSLSSTGDVHCTKRRAEAEIAPARVKTRRLSVSFLVDP